MKHKIFSVLLVLLLLLTFSSTAFAAEGDPTFHFDLSIDGKDTKEVETGDIITVVLKLKRTDSDQPYTMYAMQNEIRYDSTFFELVDGGTLLSSGIATTDIAMVDEYREFYMNFLSMSGGTQWNADTMVGSFQLRVIGKSGVTKITSQDYLVSLQDGSGSYDCTANDVTVILSSECVVHFESNGGTALPDITVNYGDKIPYPSEPTKDDYLFDGWYTDIHLTDPWNFSTDTVQGNMTLYAKWAAIQDGEKIPVNTGDSPVSSWLFIVPAILLITLIVMFILWKKKRTHA